MKKNNLTNKIVLLLISAAFSAEANIKPPLLIPPAELTGIPKFDSIEKDKEKEKVPTFWGGNALSQEERIVDGIKMNIYTLSGGAWIRYKAVHIYATKIEIFGRDAVKGLLYGKVRVVDTENGVNLVAGKGHYDKFEETITLEDRPILIYEDDKGEKTHVYATEIKRNINTKITSLHKDIAIHHKDFDIVCQNAVYDENKKVLETDEYPFVFSEDRFLTGKTLHFYTQDNRAVIDGNAILFQTTYEDPDKKKEKEEDTVDGGSSETASSEVDKEIEKEASGNTSDTAKDTDTFVRNPTLTKKNEKQLPENIILEGPHKGRVAVLSIFQGDQLRSQESENKEKTVGMYGNARIYRNDIDFYGQQIISYGEKADRVEARKNIRAYDKENHLIMYGNVLDYIGKEDYIHITDDAKVEFLEKDTDEIQSTLTATEIERYLEKKETVARGNVVITGEDSEATAEYALYEEDKDEINMQGNPSLVRDGKTLRAGRIVFFPNSKRALLTEGLDLKAGD